MPRVCTCWARKKGHVAILSSLLSMVFNPNKKAPSLFCMYPFYSNQFHHLILSLAKPRTQIKKRGTTPFRSLYKAKFVPLFCFLLGFSCLMKKTLNSQLTAPIVQYLPETPARHLETQIVTLGASLTYNIMHCPKTCKQNGGEHQPK